MKTRFLHNLWAHYCKGPRGTLLRLQIGLGTVIAATMVIAVIVPWLMARQAGVSNTNKLLSLLIQEELAVLKGRIVQFFTPLAFVANEIAATVPIGEQHSNETLRLLTQTTIRQYPDFLVSNVCVGWDDQRLDCASFYSDTMTVALQQVAKNPDGTIANDKVWITTEDANGDYWNTSFPGAPYDDYGAYNNSDWVTLAKTSPAGTYMRPNIDYTGGAVAILASLGLGIRRNGVFEGTVSLDLNLEWLTELLRTLRLTPNSHIVLLDPWSNVAGFSLDSDPWMLDSTGTPALISIWEIDNKEIRTVANDILLTADLTSDTLVSDYKLSGESYSVLISPFSGEPLNNFTLMVLFRKSDLTKSFYDQINNAFIVGMVLLFVAPAFLLVITFGVSRALIVTTKIMAKNDKEEEQELVLKTGLEVVLASLKDVQEKASGETKAALGKAIAMLSSGVGNLMQLDLAQATGMDSDQKEWLKNEAIIKLSPKFNRREQSNMLMSSSRNSRKSVATGELEEVGDPELEFVRQQLMHWDFDVWNLDMKTNPLQLLGMALAEHFNLLAEFDIDRKNYAEFLKDVAAMYHPSNPYHNSHHAADLCQCMGFLISRSRDSLMWSPTEILSLVVAGIIHDVDHHGTNNLFQIETRSELAMLYNDEHVLENHHLFVGLSLLAKHQVVDHLPLQIQKMLRKQVIELVLATDMSSHFEVLSQFRAGMASGPEQFNSEDGACRLLGMKMLMKMSDMSNTLRPQAIMKKWAEKVFDEFMGQGRLEKELGMKVSPQMDPATATLEKSQVLFGQLVAEPFANVFDEMIPIPEQLATLKKNLAYWRSLSVCSMAKPPSRDPQVYPLPMDTSGV